MTTFLLLFDLLFDHLLDHFHHFFLHRKLYLLRRHCLKLLHHTFTLIKLFFQLLTLRNLLKHLCYVTNRTLSYELFVKLNERTIHFDDFLLYSFDSLMLLRLNHIVMLLVKINKTSNHIECIVVVKTTRILTSSSLKQFVIVLSYLFILNSSSLLLC